jgi:transposase-like protein
MSSPTHTRLKAAIRRSFWGATWQRCRVHFARNLLANVPKSSAEMVASAFRTVFAQSTHEEVSAQWDQVVGQLADRFTKAAACMHAAKSDVHAFTAFPLDCWR